MKNWLFELAPRSISFQVQNQLLANRRARYFVLAALICFVGAQQVSFGRAAVLDSTYRNTLNNGASLRAFFPVFYCRGAAPVLLDTLVKTCEQLDSEIARVGKDLPIYPEQINRSTLMLYYPDVWIHRNNENVKLNQVTMRGGLSLWFAVSLSALAVALFAVRLPVLGLVVVILCASNPFQNFEIFNPDVSNLFSMVISTGLMASALVIALIGLARSGRPTKYAYLIVSALGVLMGIQYDARLEGVGVFIGVLGAILCLPRVGVRHRVALLVTLLAVGYSSNMGVNAYWDGKLSKANELVAQYDGTQGQRLGNNRYSTEWWALWSGLGDYDRKYGFLVDDRAGWSHYYGVRRMPSIGAGWSISELNKTLKTDFINAIANDPWWFAEIIGRRIHVTLVKNTPYRISYGEYFVNIPVSPTAVLLLSLVPLLLSILVGRLEYAIVAGVVASIGLVSIAQLGRYGLEFYSVLHIFLFSFVVCWTLECCLLALPWNRGAGRPRGSLPTKNHLDA